MGGKIINDPVQGFVSIPEGLLLDILQHPFFQRLNRVRQLGLSYLVYPGAQHTRLLHSVGAMNLMREAVGVLREKGHDITQEEEEAVCATMLLHDVGHAPFSHVLEHLFAKDVSHEDISLLMMKRMNETFGGRLDTCISIFENTYPKKFLHQLVSSQLDMDRLDYLNRDSFFTGVVEGAVGAERIIKMLNVWNDNLCVESKGVYSIEKFLIARRIMYWQVYYHKTSVAAERVLVNLLMRARELVTNGQKLSATPWFSYFLSNPASMSDFVRGKALDNYALFDDNDIQSIIKLWQNSDDVVLSTLCRSLSERKLFKVMVRNSPLEFELKQNLEQSYVNSLNVSKADAHYFYSEVEVSTNTYSHRRSNTPIYIMYRDGHVEDIANSSEILDIGMLSREEKKYYLCYFKL